jgi:hypothetical protein
MPKTGTSTIQEVLFYSIKSKNISYANLKVSNHSAIMFSLFSKKPLLHNIHKLNKHTQLDVNIFNKKNKELLIQGFLDNSSKTEIISGEDIFHLNEEELYDMRIFLEEYFEKIIIIGYVREAVSFMNSSFQQLVKFHKMNRFDIGKIYPHYRIKFEKFDKIFFKKNVFLYEFNINKFPNKDIVEDFANKWDIELEYKNRLRVNETISKELIAILFVYNSFSNRKDFERDNTKVHRRTINQLSQFGTNKFLFSNDYMAEVLLNHIKDIDWIENRLEVKFFHEKINKENIGLRGEEELRQYAVEHIELFYNYVDILIPNLPKEFKIKKVENIFNIIESLKRYIYEEIIYNAQLRNGSC